MNKYWRDSPSTEYRFCLDALIATISDMRRTEMCFRFMGHPTGMLTDMLKQDIARAEERAAELAGRLYDKEVAYARAHGYELDSAPCKYCGGYNRIDCAACRLAARAHRD